MTATNAGPTPGKARAAAKTAEPTTPTTVTVSPPKLGSLIDRIPVVKVSPVIQGGAYPAKASVGESIPIRAQVIRASSIAGMPQQGLARWSGSSGEKRRRLMPITR